ncbi:receptor protein kinase-like protein ZAR1 [Andrographis paniculata]|uniref:receptor protein kinase-like protein ZAR1 n=1 Tax=Andrographis paniculata TaxID=175694 RepID=UPI0021E882C1|nr:receptor protein kinase-like protein ZAR1 [Andrographis paniculata]
MEGSSSFVTAPVMASFFILFFFFKFTLSLNADGLSLLAIKAAITNDPTKALISWSDSDITPCKWDGITCDDARRRITSISLSNKNLTGYIPSEIGALLSLTFLDLSENFFSGPLPLSIAFLQTLTHLDLSSNGFNGTLPETLSNLTNLKGTLNLSYNSFSGEIPASFGRFPVMVSLDLRHNNLSGKIPQVGSLLNQGPTAFSGNPNLCGFPLGFQCGTTLEAQSPTLLSGNPQKPVNIGVSSNGVVQNRRIRNGVVTVSVISGALLVIGVVFVFVWVVRTRWKRVAAEKLGKGSNNGVGGGGAEVVGMDGKFVVLDEGFGLELEDLLRASAYVVGKSRSGIVYKVVVGGGAAAAEAGGGGAVAVRRLSEGDGKWRLKEFEAEVEAIAKVQHPNIVRLRAFYYAIDEKLLVSDFVRNGSLYTALHGGPGNTLPPLSWAARLRIAQDVARALAHIHDCGPRKHVHGSVKSTKILLDENLKPYLSGFGLSRLVPSSSSMNAIAPEARAAAPTMTQKCDVYSFGILLSEILTGRLPDRDGKGLKDAVRTAFREERPLSEIIDPNLLHEVRAKKQVVGMFHIALSCTETEAEARPKMRTVSDNLDGLKLQ